MIYTIKEAILKQLRHCELIRQDIVKNNNSLEVQKHAQKYAEIESLMVGGTYAEWIRINFECIYVFIHLDHTEYQLDFEGAYGAEMITSKDLYEFVNKIEAMSNKELQEAYHEFSCGGLWEISIPKDYIPYGFC